MERRLTRACGCGEPLEPFAKKFCPKCRQSRRADSLARAQRKFYARRREGLGTPPSRRQLLRNDEPTRWSKKNPKLALKEWHRRHPDKPAPEELLENLMTVR